MAGRWRDPAAFRADPTAAPAVRPSRRQSIALLSVLVLVAGAIAAASYLVRPDKARAFDLFHGSVFLEDSLAPVAVDLASGKPTVRLIEANTQVGAKNARDLAISPLQDGTLLLNSTTGEFNMVDSTGFIIKNNGGVPLPERAGATAAVGIASGEFAFIEQTGPTGTSVYLVGPTTVQSALIATAKVKPRAFRSMNEPSSPEPGAAASADGSLWLLVGRPGQRKIRRLTLPRNSNAGATLRATDHGTVGGPAAIGTATEGTDGSGATVVGVASGDQIQLFRAGKKLATARYPAQQGIDSILPASNALGRLSYLLHGADGWSVVSVGADGSHLRGPTPLPAAAARARLIAPAESRGDLYTMDTVSGQILRIDSTGTAAGIDGASGYPLAEQNSRVVESGGFDDAYVIARGSRVIFDSANHLRALVVFTDGSRAPLEIDKSAAVAVSASGGAEALTKSRASTRTGKPAKGDPAKPKAEPADPVNDKINCKTATQKPHIPTITQATPGSRSVLLQWSYPLLDPQDCEPSTYVLKVTLLSNSAPSPPASVTVQGQKSVNLAKLFPSTQYEISVTAFINGQGTQSSPVRVTTGPEGPAAPTEVRASTDSAGNWNITWRSCGGIARGCVPSSTWKVIPQFCDGRGLSGTPATLSVTADPTAQEQPPAQLRGGDELLGRGLRFQVEGIGQQGTVGSPSASTSCTYSWTPPVAGDISISASMPPRTTGQSSTSTTVSVRFANGQTHDLGGVGGQLTYRLLSSGSVVATRGPTTDPSVTLDGIRAGQRYQVQVLAQPPRHPNSGVTIGPRDVEAAVAAWPLPTVSATFANTTYFQGTLTVRFDFPPGTQTRGESFDLLNSSLDCGGGNSRTDLTRSDVRAGQTMIFTDISRFDFNSQNSPCTVSLQLAQNAQTTTDPPLYGAANSARVTSGPVDIEPPSVSTTPGDFQAQWTGDAEQPQILVTYHGSDQLALTSGWTITATNGTTADCGTTNDQPSATIDVDKDCIRAGGTFTVSVDYTYLLLNHPHFDGIRVDGDAPRPVDPTMISFTASWAGTARRPKVDVQYTGSEDPSSFDTFQWSETVTSSASPGVICGSATAVPGGTDVRIDVDLTKCPPALGGIPASFTVQIHFTDPNYDITGDYAPPVSGTPPA